MKHTFRVPHAQKIKTAIFPLIFFIALGVGMPVISSEVEGDQDATGAVVAASPVLQQAWQNYYATVEELRKEMEDSAIFRQPQNRVKMYHILMEMQAVVYNFTIAPRMSHPRILSTTGWQTDFYALGLPTPDFYYGVTVLDGRQTYKLRGRMGDIKLFLVQVQSHLQGSPGEKNIGNYDLDDMKVAKDGTFEIIVGGDKRSGNWIELDRNSRDNLLLFRGMLADYGHGDKGSLQIERISQVPDDYYDAEEFDEQEMAERIRRAEDFMCYLIRTYTLGLYNNYLERAPYNAMSLFQGTESSSMSNPNSSYGMGVFSLEDDEALVVRLKSPPDGVYWSFQLGDAYSRALPIDRQTSLNNFQLKRDPDGGYHAVISKRDPGVANWLDTIGWKEGTMVFRNYRAKEKPVPEFTKVKFDELPSVLPKTTARVTPTQRKAALEHRRLGLIRLYDE